VPLPALVKQAASPGSIGFAILCAGLWAVLVLLHRQRLAALLRWPSASWCWRCRPRRPDWWSLRRSGIRQPNAPGYVIVFDGDNQSDAAGRA
jgi:hypothetical protein